MMTANDRWFGLTATVGISLGDHSGGTLSVTVNCGGTPVTKSTSMWGQSAYAHCMPQ